MMNGIRGNSNEIKYPVNCAARLSAAAAGAMPVANPDLDALYEPKPDKKFVRVVTVIAYMFSVSFGKLFSLVSGTFCDPTSRFSFTTFNNAKVLTHPQIISFYWWSIRAY